jgi:hypothetical protein
MKEVKIADIEHSTWKHTVGKMEENSKVFKIQTVEKIVNYYSIHGLKSQKEVREHLDNCGLDEGSYNGVRVIRHDWKDYDGEDVKKISTVVFSPCSFFDEYMTPPPDYDESKKRYMASSTIFDEQPECSLSAKKMQKRFGVNMSHAKITLKAVNLKSVLSVSDAFNGALESSSLSMSKRLVITDGELLSYRTV